MELTKSAAQIAYEAVRTVMDSNAKHLTQPQKDLFERVYPQVTEANVKAAFDLVQRTLKKRNKPVVNQDSIDSETGKKLYELCDQCNYDRHTCGWCGEALTHSGHDSQGHLHDTEWCRPDLTPHQPGKSCTGPNPADCYWDHKLNKLKE